MTIYPYTKENYGLICEWLSLREQPIWSEDFIPETGFVASNLGSAIAMGFLRRCEGGICMIDSLISNPNVSAGLRNTALDMIANKLVETAKDMKYKGIIAHTVDLGTLQRSARHGFVKLNQTVISLNLQGEHNG